ncbi:FMRFamide receptor [Lingula anatina]|uniref:FMRFamide receptor n=1 Tax=Lingula anatina TaxID=7574 RepID=A0A1S3IC78_LINAN|nr:FMRFamide receptor [Lingula anatina]XP_013395846.1 FMRFamide receptor [Lingula anatina]XP_013395847.1 FMRFamide receptor [Lingula anatina]XP_013395848.1 FMRFamide receptor [Lingula anatina]XP_013395849.1 FMRFamide receptor [Lingula anatina]XP_013395850.1 FMRFamide receptor [Lingula anatina]XP_013395852.1 FMRFamide receptor [Lingula anatina]XP_013395853.1 FMRFamide receptor [Lingula anatina]XP_013395854.1 FMRFamide receptor [Lingula anatina]|eukprot:XP_013395845.1 FMRFamide receptor [Lingula anatina]
MSVDMLNYTAYGDFVSEKESNISFGTTMWDEIVWNKTENEGNSSASDTIDINQDPTLLMVRFIVCEIFVPIVVTFGVIGNVLNIIVLSRKWMKSSTNYYLLALASCDSLYLILALTITMKNWQELPIADMRTYWRAMAWIRPLTDIFSNASVWLTVTFTVERYIGIRHPMKGKRWCTPQRARWIILCVFIFVTIITLPEFWEYEKNPTRIYQGTALQNTDGYSVYYIWFNQISCVILPLSLLIIFNTLLIRCVWKANKMRKELSGGSQREEKQHSEQQRITVMLITVVIVFLVCQLPSAISYLVSSFIENTPRVILNRKIFGNFSNLLVEINAALNFVLYNFFSARFRKTVKRMFCMLKKPQREESMFLTDSNNKKHRTEAGRTGATYIARSRSKTPSPTRGPYRNGKNGHTHVNKNNNGYLPVNRCEVPPGEREIVGNYLTVV